jgi:hypothetical protein
MERYETNNALNTVCFAWWGRRRWRLLRVGLKVATDVLGSFVDQVPLEDLLNRINLERPL